MERTAGIESDIRGASNSIVYNPDEIDFNNENIAAAGNHRSSAIIAEGMRHVHAWVTRSNAAIPLLVSLYPIRPAYVGAPGPNPSFLTGQTWAASGSLEGVFYWGISSISTSGDGRTFGFSPVFQIQVNNTGGAPVNVSVLVHCMD